MAPVLGLLGTVVGLMVTFHSVSGAAVDPAHKADTLAEGINYSLVSTAVGLALVPVGAVVLAISIWRLIATRSRDA